MRSHDEITRAFRTYTLENEAADLLDAYRNALRKIRYADDTGTPHDPTIARNALLDDARVDSPS